MKTATKVLIITAAALVISGVAGFILVMNKLGWAFGNADKPGTETVTVDITEEFSDISVEANSEDIAFLKSDDGKCKVIFTGKKISSRFAAVENGVLKISAEKDKKWYENIVFFLYKTEKTEVYLPGESYNSLKVNTETSDITAAKELSFGKVNINASTGDIDFPAAVSGKLSVKVSTGDIKIKGTEAPAGGLDLNTSTGDIRINDINCENEVRIKVSTGSTFAQNVNCGSLVSSGSTGSITLKNVEAVASFDISRSTGDVRFEGCDAGRIAVKTSTGDVTGMFKSEKIFFTETSTGSVQVPKSLTGGECSVKTSTGDIILEIITPLY